VARTAQTCAGQRQVCTRQQRGSARIERFCEQGEFLMKASRLTAVGLVAAASLWIASGHLLPHESTESHAAMRPGDGEPNKLFRVAVAQTSLVPHRRRL